MPHMMRYMQFSLCVVLFFCGFLEAKINEPNPQNRGFIQEDGSLDPNFLEFLKKLKQLGVIQNCPQTPAEANELMQSAFRRKQDYAFIQAGTSPQLILAQKPNFYLKEFLPLFANLNLLNSIEPHGKNFDIALILGALAETMFIRFEFLISHIQKGISVGRIYILAGNRPLFGREILYLQSRFREAFPGKPLPSFQTETDVANLMKRIAEREHPELPPIEVIDNLVNLQKNARPTTATTIQALLDQWKKNPKNPWPKRMIAVSSNPHILAQHQTAKNVLEGNGLSGMLETVGPGTKMEDIKSINLSEEKALLLLMDALTGTFYGEYQNFQRSRPPVV
jgi:hypothetical protein